MVNCSIGQTFCLVPMKTALYVNNVPKNKLGMNKKKIILLKCSILLVGSLPDVTTLLLRERSRCCKNNENIIDRKKNRIDRID